MQSFLPVGIFYVFLDGLQLLGKLNNLLAIAFFLEIRYHCLTYLQSLKEIHEIDSPDESDELEAEKIQLEKAAAAGDLLISQ